MKKIIWPLVLVAITFAGVLGYLLPSQAPAQVNSASGTIRTLSTVITNANVPQSLTTNYMIRFNVGTFIGLKTSRTNNTGTVWLQFSTTNLDYGLPITAGASVTLTAPGGWYEASQFYVAGTNTDGIVAILQTGGL